MTDLSGCFVSAIQFYSDLRQISLESLATSAGLDQQTMLQLARGEVEPTLAQVSGLARCLGVEPLCLLRPAGSTARSVFPQDYVVADVPTLTVSRGADRIEIDTEVIRGAINTTHDLVDSLYAAEIDIAALLGMRNLSAFVGELFASAVARTPDSGLVANPHQDGYPDLLLMDQVGRGEWRRLRNRLNEKAPFSPFVGGGLEVKATCGAIPSPAECRRRGVARPSIGDSRIAYLKSYDWKAHHRTTNNLIGILWDFVKGRPCVAALFYSSGLIESDWGRVVTPRSGGGRTTSISIMSRSGIARMYEGWLCVLKHGGYRQFLNKRNGGWLIPGDAEDDS